MKPLLLFAAAALGLIAMIAPASAIDVTPGAYADADATIGRDIKDEFDITVKPCDCEPIADPGFFRVSRQGGGVTRVHYAMVEGTIITTTDGTAVGTVISVQNDSTGVILLLVRVDGGVLGAVDRINVRRNAFYWTGTAAVINTTIDDLRSSIQGIGLAV